MRTYAIRALALALLSVGFFPGTTTDARKNPPKPAPAQHVNALYYVNWAYDNTTYPPWTLPVANLTHIFYAFAKVARNGTVVAGRPAIDVEEPWPGAQLSAEEQAVANSSDPSADAFGSVRELYIFKKRQRTLKVLLSVGGGSTAFWFGRAVASADSRAMFVASAVRLITDWGFDGIDIDWEWPANATQIAGYAELLGATRAALDKYAKKNGLQYRFKIGVVASADSRVYELMDVAAVNEHVDFWNLLAYDYSGNNSAVATHQSNLEMEGNITEFATDVAVRYYVGQGVRPHKILIGVPLYGRAFEDTAGLGQPFSGVGAGGPNPAGVKQQEGVWWYNTLPRAGAEELWDDTARASYSYDAGTREFITYDNVQSAVNKGHYVIGRGLGGAFYWEARGDRAGEQSLVSVMGATMGHLDSSENNLDYPTSRYENIRSGMPWLEARDKTDTETSP